MKRSRYATAHRWIGLALAAFWIVQALTGAALSYTDLLDREARPPFPTVAAGPQDYADAAASVAKAAPDAQITRLMMPQSNSAIIDVYVVTQRGEYDRVRVARDDMSISSDAPWGRVTPQTPWLRIAYMIHYDLLSGKTGHVIVGLSGIFLAITAVIGLKLSWPPNGKWRPILKPIAWKRSPAAYYSWHRAVGVWFSGILLIVAITGATLVWMPSIREATGTVVAEPAVSDAYEIGFDHAGIAAAARLAQATLPDAEIYLIDPPSQALNRYRVRMREPGEMRQFYGTTAVYVSADGSQVLQVSQATKGSTAYQVLDAVYALHTGEIFGIFGRTMLFLNAIALLFMVVLGFLLWDRKRRRRNRQ
jgi:uncharacterized iron-regulated membrane protein